MKDTGWVEKAAARRLSVERPKEMWLVPHPLPCRSVRLPPLQPPPLMHHFCISTNTYSVPIVIICHQMNWVGELMNQRNQLRCSHVRVNVLDLMHRCIEV